MNYINSGMLNQHQISSLQEHHQLNGQFDPTSSQEDFLEQLIMSSVPSSASSFAWPDDQPFQSANPENDAAIKALFSGFNQDGPNQHFLPSQAQNFGTPESTGLAAPAVGQPAATGTQARQRVRARRGQATDPHSIAERLRRERIAERMKGLQELVPNANKTDKASMLDEIIDYVKFLQLQVKVLSMSRLGGASAVAPLVADMSSEGQNGNGTQTATLSSNNEVMTGTENQVAKLLQEDMGSAMQYLQGKGLCLMPISLATAISTTTSRTRNPSNNPQLINGDLNSTNMLSHKDLPNSVSRP